MPPGFAGFPAEQDHVVGPDLAIIIVSYHCRDQVLACVASVLETVLNHRLEVMVVDNDSRDGTITSLHREFPEVEVVEMRYNAGFSCANNRGIAATSARHVLVLNPDTIVEPTALDGLIDWLDDHPEVGVVAPRLVFPDGRGQLTARAFPTPAAAIFGRRSPLTRIFPHNRWSTRSLIGREHLGDEPFAVDWVSGAAMMVPRTVINEVGAFDEDFFLYWEDADWCRRIKDAGYEVWCVPKATVVHDEGGTRGHGWPAPIVGHFHDGAYRYFRKHHAPQWWNPVRWLAFAALRARALAVTTRNRFPVSSPQPSASVDSEPMIQPEMNR